MSTTANRFQAVEDPLAAVHLLVRHRSAVLHASDNFSGTPSKATDHHCGGGVYGTMAGALPYDTGAVAHGSQAGGGQAGGQAAA